MVMRRMRAEWIAFHLDALADELLEALRYNLIGGINLDGIGARHLVHLIRATQASRSRQGEDVGSLRTVIGVPEGAEREPSLGHLPILIRLQAFGRCGRGADHCREREGSKPQSHASLPERHHSED